MNQERFEQGTKQLYDWLTEGKAKLDSLIAEARQLPDFEETPLYLSIEEMVFLAYGPSHCVNPDCLCDRCSMRRKAIAALAERQSTQVPA